MPTLEQKVGQAGRLYAELEKTNTVRNHFYWQQGELLWKLKQGNLYKNVFGDQGNQSWSSFLSEVGIPLSSAAQKVSNHQFFVVDHGFTAQELAGADTSCLYYVARYRADESTEQIREYVTQLRNKVLGRGDFIANIKGEDCGHTHAPIKETVLKCPDCGKKVGSTHG